MKKKYILIILFLFFITKISSQVTKLRTTSVIVQLFENEVWLDWSPPFNISSLVVLNFDIKRFEIYTDKKQEYDVIKVLSNEKYNDGGSVFVFECINENGENAVVSLIKEKIDGIIEKSFLIELKKTKLLYSLKEIGSENKNNISKPDQSITEKLNDIINEPNTNDTSSNGGGNKEYIENIHTNTYYSDGNANNSDFDLTGRKKLNANKFAQDCNEKGKVLVKIFVNRKGKVIKCTIQQSDNPCLNSSAKKTAMSYEFDYAPNAPLTQIGFVIINFSLNE